jgi:hypothetical protein
MEILKEEEPNLDSQRNLKERIDEHMNECYYNELVLAKRPISSMNSSIRDSNDNEDDYSFNSESLSISSSKNDVNLKKVKFSDYIYRINESLLEEDEEENDNNGNDKE